MKKKEKKKQKPTPGADLKKILITLIALIIVLPIGIIIFSPETFFFPAAFISQRQEEAQNPAKNISAVMPPFALEHKLELIEEYNGFAGLPSDNTTPYYIYIYQGDQSLDEMKALLKQYLESKGYHMNASFSAYSHDCSILYGIEGCADGILPGLTINDNKPYWVFEGKNDMNDEISVEISDQTYFNPANNAGDNAGENIVPLGKTVAVITFTSNSQ